MNDGRFEAALREIKMIRRKTLSEREFCTRIVEALYKMGYTHQLSDEEFVSLRDALKSKGCMSIEEFREKLEEEGMSLPKRGLSFESGSIMTAYAFIGQFFSSKEASNFALDFANHGYEEALALKWLIASKKRLDISLYFRKKSDDLRVYLAEEEKRKKESSESHKVDASKEVNNSKSGNDPRCDN